MKHLPIKKILLSFGAILSLLIVSSISFIKLDTAEAANFTDYILRPVFGNTAVVFVESVFFNLDDYFNHYIYKVKEPIAPTANGNVYAAPKQDTKPSLNSSSSQANILPADYINLSPISLGYFSPLPNEGQWQVESLPQFPNQVAIATTFIRPDPQRSYAIVTLVKMNMSKMGLSAVAGIKEPGGSVGNPGPGKVPLDVQKSENLIAAFNGGFQEKDGQYGMIVGTKTYLPLEDNIGTLVIHKDGRIEIINYTGQSLGNDVVAVRQNCPILIDNSVITPLTSKGSEIWGKTITNNMYTWRSGLGISSEGNLIYAVGSSLTPTTLAEALKDAGAVNAIQLDINPFWTRFTIFKPIVQGGYTYTSIMKELQNGGFGYLNGYNKDFFYLYKKP